jgi:hypothetical protein
VLQDFGQQVAQNKPQNETYQQQYRHLNEARDVRTEALAGRVDGLIALEQRGITLDTLRRSNLPGSDELTEFANRVAKEGHLNVLN